MKKCKILLLLPLTLLFSCVEKQNNIQEKAQNLIINTYSDTYASKPIFEFCSKIIKYDKEKFELFEPLLRYTAELDERAVENIGYVLRYILTVDNNTYIFIATFCQKVENIITNDLYEDFLCESDMIKYKEYSTGKEAF